MNELLNTIISLVTIYLIGYMCIHTYIKTNVKKLFVMSLQNKQFCCGIYHIRKTALVLTRSKTVANSAHL